MCDELSTALQELAARNEAPPLIGGFEVRGRAVRRGRRRRAVLAFGAGAAALALTAFALTLNAGDGGEHRQAPAATPRLPSPSASASASASATSTPVSGTVDLNGRTLTVDDRALAITSGSVRSPAPVGLMTVSAKWDLKRVTTGELFKGVYEVTYPYVIELRDAENDQVYVGALDHSKKARATDTPTTGWIGLALNDAAWLYERLKVGDSISVIAENATEAPADTALPRTIEPTPAVSAPAVSAPAVSAPARTP